MLEQKRRSGLAVGPGDADHIELASRVTLNGLRSEGETEPHVAHLHDGDAHVRKARATLHQDRGRTALHRSADERHPIGPLAASGDEQISPLHTP